MLKPYLAVNVRENVRNGSIWNSQPPTQWEATHRHKCEQRMQKEIDVCNEVVLLSMHAYSWSCATIPFSAASCALFFSSSFTFSLLPSLAFWPICYLFPVAPNALSFQFPRVGKVRERKTTHTRERAPEGEMIKWLNNNDYHTSSAITDRSILNWVEKHSTWMNEWMNDRAFLPLFSSPFPAQLSSCISTTNKMKCAQHPH